MPSFKLTGVKAQEVKSGFEPYDGPEPTRKGFYRGVIKSMKHGLNSNSGSQGFTIVLELEAAKGDPKDHAIFDGYPMFSRSIITETKGGVAMKEGAVSNLQNLLAALGVKDEPDVVLDKGDDDKVDVLKIGGKKPIGMVVNIDMGFALYEGERRPEVGGIYKYKESDAVAGKATFVADEDEEDESDLMDDEASATDAEGDDDEFTVREAELGELGIPTLKKIAKELGVGISGTKAALVERILDEEFKEVEEDEEDDETEDDETEDDETEDEDEEEDDEEEEEDEEAEDEDDEAKVERVAELGNIARVGLKSILKEVAPDFTVLKRHSDEELRAAIIAVEFAEDLPF